MSCWCVGVCARVCMCIFYNDYTQSIIAHWTPLIHSHTTSIDLQMSSIFEMYKVDHLLKKKLVFFLETKLNWSIFFYFFLEFFPFFVVLLFVSGWHTISQEIGTIFQDFSQILRKYFECLLKPNSIRNCDYSIYCHSNERSYRHNTNIRWSFPTQSHFMNMSHSYVFISI